MSAASSLIPLNFQIAEGIAGGCVVYTVLVTLSEKTRELHWFLGVFSLLFVLHFVTK
jgi:xanthine/uracil/vitamin C permease (AzgA family)